MILDEIVSKRKEHYKKIMEEFPLSTLISKINSLEIEDNIKFYDLVSKKEFIYICECKKASPSKGIIRENYNYIDIAKAYEKYGADCISCLTEPDYFLGSDEHLINIRKNVNIPILRKDFIFDEYQIYESKLLGADIILLICSILDDEKLKRFISIAHSLSLGCLVETHSDEEIDRAIKANAKVIGVNNRNLKDFTINNELSIKLREKYPDITLISESGIKGYEDIVNIKKAKLNGVLVGEYLMRADSIELALGELKK